VGGLFLARDCYKKFGKLSISPTSHVQSKSNTKSPYLVSDSSNLARNVLIGDFVKGNIITIEDPITHVKLFSFQVLKSDLSTKKLIKRYPIIQKSQLSISYYLTKIGETLKLSQVNIRQFFDDIFNGGGGSRRICSFDEFSQFLRDHLFRRYLASQNENVDPSVLSHISSHCLSTLMEQFQCEEKEGEGMMDVDLFIDNLVLFCPKSSQEIHQISTKFSKLSIESQISFHCWNLGQNYSNLLSLRKDLLSEENGSMDSSSCSRSHFLRTFSSFSNELTLGLSHKQLKKLILSYSVVNSNNNGEDEEEEMNGRKEDVIVNCQLLCDHIFDASLNLCFDYSSSSASTSEGSRNNKRSPSFSSHSSSRGFNTTNSFSNQDQEYDQSAHLSDANLITLCKIFHSKFVSGGTKRRRIESLFLSHDIGSSTPAFISNPPSPRSRGRQQSVFRRHLISKSSFEQIVNLLSMEYHLEFIEQEILTNFLFKTPSSTINYLDFIKAIIMRNVRLLRKIRGE